jgi:predicted NBD/HSP70 family sugar kinase
MTFHFAHVHSRGFSMYYLAIDLHKTESYVVVIDEDGPVVEETEVPNDELEGIAREYAGREAVVEATTNYFAVYDRLSEYLDVRVANPAKMAWVTECQKSDRGDAT